MKKILAFTLMVASFSACSNSSYNTVPVVPQKSFNQQQNEKLLGQWKMGYTIISNFTDSYNLTKLSLSTSGSSAGEYYVDGINTYSNNLVVASYYAKDSNFSLLDDGSVLDRFFTFDFSSDNVVNGCFYAIIHPKDDFSSCYKMYGTKNAIKTAGNGVLLDYKLVNLGELGFLSPQSIAYAQVRQKYQALKDQLKQK